VNVHHVPDTIDKAGDSNKRKYCPQGPHSLLEEMNSKDLTNDMMEVDIINTKDEEEPAR